MSDDKNLESVTSPIEKAVPMGSPSLEDLFKDAQGIMAELRELVESARTSETAAAEAEKLTSTALTDAQGKLAEITATATQAIAAKTKITDDQAVIATKSDHIQQAQEHADKVRGELDRALTAARAEVTASEAQKSAAQTVAEEAAKLLTAIRTTKGTIDTDGTAVGAVRKAAEDAAAVTQGLADKSKTVEERIAAYEQRLSELGTQGAEQLKTIESLLPGATSAGLAHAWDQRRQTFLKPQRQWERLFIGSLSVIFLITGTGVWKTFFGPSLTYGDIGLMWLIRLPVVGILVWLALHASREAALAKQLEEDYGYKAVVAASFLGFHKQMSEIGPDAVAQLCTDTLKTISSPPGRIYDKHKLTISPGEEVKAAAEAVAAVTKAGSK